MFQIVLGIFRYFRVFLVILVIFSRIVFGNWVSVAIKPVDPELHV